MKKLLCMFLALVMLFGLMACGKDEDVKGETPSAEVVGATASKEKEPVEAEERVVEIKEEEFVVEEADEPVTEEAVEVKEGEPAVETEEPAEPASSSEEMVDGMRASFKEAMDSYEVFYDEYIVFMEKYKTSDNAATMLADYLKFLEQAQETNKKFEEWDSEDMNDAELKYYLEVTTRVAQKLIDATGE